MSDDKEVDEIADQYLAAIDDPIRMIEPATQVYKDIIKKLLLGWKPNYETGELKKQWWHPYKPFNNVEAMTSDEYSIILELDDKISTEALRKLEGLE